MKEVVVEWGERVKRRRRMEETDQFAVAYNRKLPRFNPGNVRDSPQCASIPNLSSSIRIKYIHSY